MLACTSKPAVESSATPATFCDLAKDFISSLPPDVSVISRTYPPWTHFLRAFREFACGDALSIPSAFARVGVEGLLVLSGDCKFLGFTNPMGLDLPSGALTQWDEVIGTS